MTCATSVGRRAARTDFKVIGQTVRCIKDATVEWDDGGSKVRLTNKWTNNQAVDGTSLQTTA